MSKIIFYLFPLMLSLSVSTRAQVGIGKKDQVHRSHPSAILDMDVDTNIISNRRGVLFPLIPLKGPTDRTSISNPADYLLVFSPYTGTSPYIGLSYWHGNRWNRLLNETELFDSISHHHVVQIVLFANLSTEETRFHVTDSYDATPYRLKFDNINFDSQAAYDKQLRAYKIPETGLYEIVCSATLSIAKPGNSTQSFIRIGNMTVASNLVSMSSTTSVNSVIYIAELKKGDLVSGAVGVGKWDTDNFKVMNGSLLILKH